LVIVREPFLFPFTRPPLSRAPSLSLMALLLLLLTSEPDHHARERERENGGSRDAGGQPPSRLCDPPLRRCPATPNRERESERGRERETRERADGG